MRLLLGIATVAATAAGIAAWMSPGPDSELAVVSDVGKGGIATLSSPAGVPDRHSTGEAAEKPRFFGFALTTVPTDRPASSQVAAPSPKIEVATAPPAPARMSWSQDVVVYAETQASEIKVEARIVPTANRPPAPAVAQPPRDKPRAELVKELQRELSRIGCYAGEINGEWGQSAKRALRSFMEHVGSRGQVDDPDLMQLTLVRGFSGSICRPANGQMTASRQPIAPAPVHLTLPPVSSPSSQVATGPVEQPQAPAARAIPLEGRMAVGGPVPEGAVDPAAPPQAAPPTKPARPAPRQPRQDRAWLNNFFSN